MCVGQREPGVRSGEACEDYSLETRSAPLISARIILTRAHVQTFQLIRKMEGRKPINNYDPEAREVLGAAPQTPFVANLPSRHLAGRILNNPVERILVGSIPIKASDRMKVCATSEVHDQSTRTPCKAEGDSRSMSAYREQEIKRALGKLDFSRVELLISQAFEEVTPEIVDRLILDVVHTGCLILPHRTAETASRRETFGAQLKQYVQGYGTESATRRLTAHLAEGPLIERGFDEILATFRTCSFNALTLQQQVWAFVDRVGSEIGALHRELGQPGSFSHAITDKGEMLADAALLSTCDIGGHRINPDATINGAVCAVGNFMQMLSHWHGWFDGNGIIKVPPQVQTDEMMQFQVGTVGALAAAWASLNYAVERLRFENGTLASEMKTFRLASGETTQIEALVFEHKHKLELIEAVARLRQHHLLLQNIMKFEQGTLKPEKVTDPRTGIVPLSPEAYISREECLAALIMEFSYRLPIFSSAALFGGLMLSQWLRGYAVLQAVFGRDEKGNNIYHAVRLDKATLLHTLKQSGLSPDQAGTFLHHCTFQKGKTDLFDAPVVMDASGQLYLMTFVLQSAALWEIVQSQLASQDQQIDKKGAIFEQEVGDLFESHGIPAHRVSFRLRETEYECDLAVLWDRHLFLFECKNFRLPQRSGRESYHFWQKLDSAAKQIRRIGADLVNNPGILQGCFGPDAEWDHLHLCVLNAMPFSFPEPMPGLHFYDASALGKFFTDGKVNFVSESWTGKTKILFRQPIAELWTADKPAPEDLLNQMKSPIQFRSRMRDWAITQTPATFSERLAMIQSQLVQSEVAPEQILASLDISAERQKVLAKERTGLRELIRRGDDNQGG
jgi:hypothetical protein